MKEKLLEIVTKAAASPASYPDLVLVYQRGHEMSGITRFELGEGGRYDLSSDNPRRQTSAHFEGALDVDQRRALFSAVLESGLLDIPSSTRNMADDEIPYDVELHYDDMQHQLTLWARDARENAGFRLFETALWNLFSQLSRGEISPAPLR